MSIANRVGALVVAALLALLAVDAYVLRDVVLPSYVGMDEARARDEIKRVQAELDNELEQLGRLATDWAAWDDAYRFAKDRNQEFLKSNLETSAMLDQRLALMWYVDPEGKTIWGRALSPDQPVARPHPSFPGQGGLPIDNPLIRVKEPDIGVSGLMQTPLGTMAVASHPIVTSHFQGPLRGFVVFGRLLDDKHWQKIGERLGVEVNGLAATPILSQESPQQQALASLKPGEIGLSVMPGGKRQSAQLLLYDLEGKPAILLKTDSLRQNFALGQETLRAALIALAASGILLMGLVYLQLRFYVTRPLRQLAIDIKSMEGSQKEGIDILPAARGEVARVSKEVRGMLDRIAYLSHIDALTGLPNRGYFTERATHALSLSRRHEMKSAVLLLDLDGFKEVNETLGHDAGDRLLVAVAGRLRTLLRECDTLARFGGDEFLILAENLPAVTGAADLAIRILHLFKEPLISEDIRHGRSCSIGIAIFPDDAQTVEDLLRMADIAMYRAKSSGGNTWRCHAESLECRREKGPEKSPAPSES